MKDLLVEELTSSSYRRMLSRPSSLETSWTQSLLLGISRLRVMTVFRRLAMQAGRREETHSTHENKDALSYDRGSLADNDLIVGG